MPSFLRFANREKAGRLKSNKCLKVRNYGYSFDPLLEFGHQYFRSVLIGKSLARKMLAFRFRSLGPIGGRRLIGDN